MYQTLFINFCLLVTLAFVGSQVLDVQPVLPKSWLTRLSYVAGLTLTGLVLMQYPVFLDGGMRIDLRLVVPAIGGLYGGTWFGLATTVPVALYRLLLGGPGTEIGVVRLIVTAVLAGLLRPEPDAFDKPFWHSAWRPVVALVSTNLLLLAVPGQEVQGHYGLYLTMVAACIAGVLVTALIFRQRLLARRAMAEMTRLAHHDHLTGLPNLRCFEQALQERPPVGTEFLLLLDLDHFKHVNDSEGHLVGNEVLKAVAGIIRDQVRGQDLVSRYGGEEFAVLLRGCTPAQAIGVADRVRGSVERHKFATCRGKDVHVTLSGGLYPLPPGADVLKALDAADALLYRAKAEGRNRIIMAAGVS